MTNPRIKTGNRAKVIVLSPHSEHARCAGTPS